MGDQDEEVLADTGADDGAGTGDDVRPGDETGTGDDRATDLDEDDPDDEEFESDEDEPEGIQDEVGAEGEDDDVEEDDDYEDDDYEDDSPDDDSPDDEVVEDEKPEDEEPEERPDPPRRRIGARAAARAAVEQIAEMTGRAPEGVTFVRKQDDSWLVGVEVVETERIPDSSDVLAVYEAELDDEAELMSYQRVRRYPRGRGDDD
ncbi:gas vesicle protein [Pseudonocardia tropica]|uniref:Gas vesicle protein n=1 Tax=Pseudonocardia tropica TaxID=681289 RepID=A0ABV1JRF5_9PSEU